jgi:ketosteroid isomerase-like protein
MKPTLLAALASSLVLVATGAPATPPTPVERRMSAAECAVFEREVGFALSVENHDSAAFAEHVLPGAVFGVGPQARRGRTEIVQAWSGILASDPPLRWRPRAVAIGTRPDLALSHGPWWMELPQPDGSTKILIGEFTTTWMRDSDGAWRVLFDAGSEPREATPGQLAAHRAQAPAACPKED